MEGQDNGHGDDGHVHGETEVGKEGWRSAVSGLVFGIQSLRSDVLSWWVVNGGEKPECER